MDDEEYTDVDFAMQYFKEVGGRQIVVLEYICGGTSAYCYADSASDGAISDGWVRIYIFDTVPIGSDMIQLIEFIRTSVA